MLYTFCTTHIASVWWGVGDDEEPGFKTDISLPKSSHSSSFLTQLNQSNHITTLFTPLVSRLKPQEFYSKKNCTTNRERPRPLFFSKKYTELMKKKDMDTL